MAEYSETVTPPDDTRAEILETFAKGQPWAFIVAVGEGDNLDLEVSVGGGINNPALVRGLLNAVLAALPEPSPDDRPIVGGGMF